MQEIIGSKPGIMKMVSGRCQLFSLALSGSGFDSGYPSHFKAKDFDRVLKVTIKKLQNQNWRYNGP